MAQSSPPANDETACDRRCVWEGAIDSRSISGSSSRLRIVACAVQRTYQHRIRDRQASNTDSLLAYRAVSCSLRSTSPTACQDYLGWPQIPQLHLGSPHYSPT